MRWKTPWARLDALQLASTQRSRAEQAAAQGRLRGRALRARAASRAPMQREELRPPEGGEGAGAGDAGLERGRAPWRRSTRGSARRAPRARGCGPPAAGRRPPRPARRRPRRPRQSPPPTLTWRGAEGQVSHFSASLWPDAGDKQSWCVRDGIPVAGIEWEGRSGAAAGSYIRDVCTVHPFALYGLFVLSSWFVWSNLFVLPIYLHQLLPSPAPP